jgi:hypothetical protein
MNIREFIDLKHEVKTEIKEALFNGSLSVEEETGVVGATGLIMEDIRRGLRPRISAEEIFAEAVGSPEAALISSAYR